MEKSLAQQIAYRDKSVSGWVEHSAQKYVVSWAQGQNKGLRLPVEGICLYSAFLAWLSFGAATVVVSVSWLSAPVV